MLKKAVVGLGWVSGLSLAQVIATLSLTMVLARLLAPEDFGSYALCLVIVSFVQVVCQLGISAATIQIENVDDRFFSTGFSLVLLASSVVTILSFFGIWVWLTAFPPQEEPEANMLSYLHILVFSLPFIAIAEYFQAIFNRDLAFRLPAKINFASYILVFAVVSLVLASQGLGVYALTFAYVAQHVLRASLLFFGLEKRPVLGITGTDVRRILRYGLGFSIAKVGNVVALQVDNLIVASTLGNGALGLYSRSYQMIMTPISLITAVVDRVLFPVMSLRQNEVTTLRQAFFLLNGAIFAVFLPLSLALYEYRHEAVLILFGNAWLEASAPFGFLSIALPFRASYRLSDIVARARGYVYRRAVVQWVYAASIIVGCLVGSIWGIGGVALGVSGAVVVNWLLLTALTMRSLQIGFADLLGSFRPALFTVAVTYLAAAGLNLALGRTLPISAGEISGLIFVVVAMLLAVFMKQFAWAAQQDWLQIYQRARDAG